MKIIRRGGEYVAVVEFTEEQAQFLAELIPAEDAAEKEWREVVDELHWRNAMRQLTWECC